MNLIEAEYNDSLRKKEISARLRVDVKHVLGNLRSALDYLACDIREIHCPNVNPKDRFYFPILRDRSHFNANVRQWFPGIDTTCVDLFNYLESVQPYKKGYEWLGEFNKINNENKHDRLVSQEKHETCGGGRITTPDVGSITWNKGVTFTKGVSLMGAPIDPATQMPVPNPGQKVERIIWVDFRFEGTSISVLGLLKKGQKGIKNIVDSCQKWL
jgi:hypothetical protein